jgi:integrase
MGRLSYLTRRAGGVYYLQMRMPSLAGALPLFRFSLRTRDYRQARRILLQRLVWLLPLADAVTIDDRITAILDKLASFKAAGRPKTEDEFQDRLGFEAVNDRFVREVDVMDPAPVRALALLLGWTQFVTMLERGFAEKDGEETLAGGADQSEVSDIIISDATPDISAPVGVLPSEPPPRRPDGPVITHLPMSQVLAKFLETQRKQHGDGRAEANVAPIVRFAINLLNDPAMTSLTGDQELAITTEMANIPTLAGFSPAERDDLFKRHQIAKACGFRRPIAGKSLPLVRVSKGTLKNRYRVGLRTFFLWAIAHKFAYGPAPDFTFTTPQNPGKRVRDAFTSEEMVRLCSMPLFTGCAGKTRVWQEGLYFFQSFFYWSVLISLMSGMRPGEVSQLRCCDVLELYDEPHFRFARFSGSDDNEDDDLDRPGANQGKTPNAFRWVPIHPLLVRLGILERRDALINAYVTQAKRTADNLSAEERNAQILFEAGQQWLFPDWKVYVKKTDQILWSQSVSKAWGHLKETYGFDRKGVTLYSARHTFKGHIDDLRGLSERSRRVLTGHSTEGDVPGQYGPKKITEEQMKVALALDNDAIKQITVLLVAAKERAERGELKTIDAWQSDERGNDEKFQTAMRRRATQY